jgi:hypothetical protein
MAYKDHATQILRHKVYRSEHPDEIRIYHAIRNGAQYRLDKLIEQQGLCTYCWQWLDLTDAVADHDHDCCGTKPFVRRCGECERDVIHSLCNTSLGWTLAHMDYALVYEDRFNRRAT